MKKALELDVYISAPDGVTKEMAKEMTEAIYAAAEEAGCTVGGSFTLVDEVTDGE